MAFFRSGGIRIAVVSLAVLALLGAIGAGVGYLLLTRDLPDFRTLDDYNPPVVSEVYDRNGQLIGEFFTQKRRIVPIEAIPEHVKMAFVAAEDGAFFEHQGVDYVSILRAALANFREGRKVQGASTITQQMVKTLLLTPERTYKRKLREIILARRIEQAFTKDEILFLYLNQIYFGNGAWGIGQAARSYFGKDASELSVSEAALLAGLPQRPSDYEPNRNPEAADTRRRYVLGRMLDDGYIDEPTYQTALASKLKLARHPDLENTEIAAYFTEEVRRLLYDRLGGEVVNTEGLRVETTLDIKLQRAAKDAVQKGLVAHDHRRGYRGPLRRVAEDEISAELARIGQANAFLAPASPSAETPTATEAGAAENGERAAESVLAESEAPAWPVNKPIEGVVLRVNRSKKSASIGLGPEIEAEVQLKDVDWARVPNEKQRSRPVEKIEQIFSVGDVASFTPLETIEVPHEKGKPYRVALWQEPAVEGALLSLENSTGNVLALIGGYDFARSEFNRAVQAQRQPGSAFKPFIYGAALTRGFTPVSKVIDRPVVYTDPVTGFVWAPRNYGRKFYGPMTMRDALKKSINNATVHLFRDLGVRYVIDYARRFGIQAPLSSDLSLALGSSAVTLLEITRAYAVYPAGGKRVVPRFIVRVTDREGNELLSDVPLGEVPPPVLKELSAPGEEREESYPDSEILPSKQIISPADAYLVSDLLRAVVNEGTGRGLRRLGRTVAGKTGTTNDYSDAWFMGFSPEITTGVWVGHDDNTVLGAGESGGKTALPIWGDFMEVALAPYPRQDFKVPANIEFQRIDKASGLLADAATTDAYFQPFLAGTAPERSFTDKTDTDRGRQAARDDFF